MYNSGFFCAIVFVCGMICDAAFASASPSIPGKSLSTDWRVQIDNKPVAIYSAVVFRGGPAYFCQFEINERASIIAQPAWPVRNAVVRPLSRKVEPSLHGHEIHFELNAPGVYSVEPNGLTTHPLFIFANPAEEPAPEPDAPALHYFGPGIHVVDESISLTSGDVVYLHPRAWLKVVMPKYERPVAAGDAQTPPRYAPLFAAADAENITIRGRGVIDMSALDWNARPCMQFVRCKNIHIEGVVVVDCPAWTIVVAQSDMALIENVKLIGHRQSNDGITLLNSRDITVRNCFTRVGDDGIVVKTFPDVGEARDITVEGCVVWNDKCRGIGITAETAEPIANVVFRDIDIIHDLSGDFNMAWTMAVYMEDCGPITDILFEDIRCENTREQFIQIAIHKGIWATTDRLGSIERVTFRNVHYLGENTPRSMLQGHDPENRVMDIRFENLTFRGQVILNAEEGTFEVNEYVHNLEFIETEPVEDHGRPK